ncbi:class I SAM-dependent methyltransferase [Paracoccus litorisediminis]|uniref:class I SAM-dependent methyltransferase n=1 Tax=Paracoccus litorisediminis TaxID=2006130 RepID=UPI001B8D3B64|nr:class I SAM-dependent methyltransferase [Paracoccus litorisediminis]
MKSTGFYDSNAESFIARTVGVDMSEHRQRFLRTLPPGGAILDAGCGSGRDTLAFRQLGYDVSAFDGSIEMVRATSRLAGIPVRQIIFEDFDWDRKFDGIWACASLLHIPRSSLPAVLDRLANTLLPTGVIYASIKLGAEERVEGDRFFNDLDEAGLNLILAETKELSLVELWQSMDRRSDRSEVKWLNCLLSLAN